MLNIYLVLYFLLVFYRSLHHTLSDSIILSYVLLSLLLISYIPPQFIIAFYVTSLCRNLSNYLNISKSQHIRIDFKAFLFCGNILLCLILSIKKEVDCNSLPLIYANSALNVFLPTIPSTLKPFTF